MPQTCFAESNLTGLSFRSQEIKILVLDLDASGGAAPDEIFPFFLKKTADVISTKIAAILCKCARAGKLSTC